LVFDFTEILKADYDSGDCLDADAFPTTSILKLKETATRVSKSNNSSNTSVFQIARHPVRRSARPVLPTARHSASPKGKTDHAYAHSTKSPKRRVGAMLAMFVYLFGKAMIGAALGHSSDGSAYKATAGRWRWSYESITRRRSYTLARSSRGSTPVAMARIEPTANAEAIPTEK
jgi:hypothetical protein